MWYAKQFVSGPMDAAESLIIGTTCYRFIP
jgi:hypothetical protein